MLKFSKMARNMFKTTRKNQNPVIFVGKNKSCIWEKCVAIPLLMFHLFLSWNGTPHPTSAMELSSEYPGNRIDTPGDATGQCQGYTVGAIGHSEVVRAHREVLLTILRNNVLPSILNVVEQS